MICEALLLVTSYHFDRDFPYNERNPGVIVAVGDQPTDWFRYYATGGVYLDSMGDVATLAGVGCDFGKTFGAGLTVAHVDGSGMRNLPVAPLPSLFYRQDECTVRVFIMPQAVALGFSYTIGH